MHEGTVPGRCDEPGYPGMLSLSFCHSPQLQILTVRVHQHRVVLCALGPIGLGGPPSVTAHCLQCVLYDV